MVKRTSKRVAMPRKMRVEYAWAIYHVMSRGERREGIFLEDVDRQDSSAPWRKPARRRGSKFMPIA